MSDEMLPIPIPQLSGSSFDAMSDQEEEDLTKDIRANYRDLLRTLTEYFDNIPGFDFEQAKIFVDIWVNNYEQMCPFLPRYKDFCMSRGSICCFLSAYLEGKDTTDPAMYPKIISFTKYGQELINYCSYREVEDPDKIPTQ